MARVKLGFSRFSAASKILVGRTVVTNMTANDHFTNPQPDLALVTDSIDLLEKAAQQASKGGTDKTIAKHIAEDNLNVLMSQLQDYVQTASAGAPIIIVSSGMEVRKERTPAILLGAVQKPNATVGGNPGKIELTWDSLSGAKSYVVEMKVSSNRIPPLQATDSISVGDSDVFTQNALNAIEWIRIDTVTKSKLTLKGLETGTVHSFRVAGINAAGQGDYSQVVSSVAP